MIVQDDCREYIAATISACQDLSAAGGAKRIGGRTMRRIPGCFVAVALLALAGAPAHADNYPSRRITLIAPWPPAGAIDAVCRELAPGVGDILGQPVVVENRPGAGSTIGTADGAKAAPDGYTLVLAGSGSLAISPTLYKELAYDPRKDFTPIALVVRVPFILVVNPSLPIESVADLISYAKAHPGALTYGSRRRLSANCMTHSARYNRVRTFATVWYS